MELELQKNVKTKRSKSTKWFLFRKIIPGIPQVLVQPCAFAMQEEGSVRPDGTYQKRDFLTEVA